jgi:hypothetical protein
MKRLLSIVVFTLICASQLPAADATVEAVMAKDQDSEPTDTFAVDVPKLFAFFKTKGSKKGDKFRAVWIAEEVGDAADPETTIGEDSLAADQDDAYGAFSLSKPTNGWPIGKYRVEIYLGDSNDAAASVKFTINQSGESEGAEESSSEE